MLRADVNWKALPAGTPLSVRQLLRRCLVRQPKDRLHDIGDPRLEIEEAISAAGPGASDIEQKESIPPPTRSWVWRLAPWALAGVATAAAAAAWVWRPAGSPTASGIDLPVRLSITLPPGDELAVSSFRTLAISPDGRDILSAVDRAGTRLLLRRSLGGLDAVPVAGSEGGATMPLFSADGASIAFWLPGVGVAAVPTAGGAVRTLCETYDPGGATWAADGGLIVGGRKGLVRCSPGSVRPESLTSIGARDDALGHQEPQALPDGRVRRKARRGRRTENLEPMVRPPLTAPRMGGPG